MNNIKEKLENVKDLLNTVKIATMATTNEDGSPHNSPYVFMISKDLTKLYWGSHPKSIHSQNIQRTGQLFVVLYDAFNWREGLYIRAENGHIAREAELVEALEVHNDVRKKYRKDPIHISYYADGEQEMWIADTTGFWTNGRVNNEKGHLVKDITIEIKREDLV